MLKQQIKSAIRQIIASIYYAANHPLTHLQGKVVILTYHRVISVKELNQNFIQPGMYVRADVFEKQMQFLKEHFQILSFTELLNLWNEKTFDETKRYCVITFDDGWLDNYTNAYPVLKKYDIPATIFLPTAFISTDKWFWPDKISYLLMNFCNSSKIHEFGESLRKLLSKYDWLSSLNIEKIDSAIESCKNLPEEDVDCLIREMSNILGLKIPDERLLINWKEIKKISKHGVSFGSHSCNHKILTKLSTTEIKKELEDSLHTLQKKRINYIPVFCYPNGSYNKEITVMVKAAGYQAAVSTHFGFENDLPQDLFSLKRIGIHNDISSTIPLFAYRLSKKG